MLDTDREHLRHHTKWSQRAIEWNEKNHSADLLLRGSELAVAQAWLKETQEQKKQPAATELQKAYIAKSRGHQRKKRWLLTGAVVGVMGVVTALGLNAKISQNPGPPPSSSGGRLIVNFLSRKCIDVRGAPGSTNETPLVLWDCETSGFNRDNNSFTDQRWTLGSDGFIRNTLSGKCIDVKGSPGSTNGSRLVLWDCETSGVNRDNGLPTDQRWTLGSDGFIRNTLSGKCIDVEGRRGIANGTPLILRDCETSVVNPDNGLRTYQRWDLQE